jgi:hypothetical protein
MIAIGAAIETLFNDPNLSVTALYRTQGVGEAVAIRVIARRPDQVSEFGDIHVHSESSIFDVRVAEVANPRPADTLEIDGETFIVQGEPVRDAERLVWSLDTRPF